MESLGPSATVIRGIAGAFASAIEEALRHHIFRRRAAQLQQVGGSKLRSQPFDRIVFFASFEPAVRIGLAEKAIPAANGFEAQKRARRTMTDNSVVTEKRAQSFWIT